jgi:hypothetical protein
VCHGFHDAADHNAVGQIEVIVAPFVGQTAHVDRKAVPQQNRAAVRRGGEQLKGAATVGLGATAVTVGLGHWSSGDGVLGGRQDTTPSPLY